MFSVKQKRTISDAVQKVLRDTNHPELPEGEIRFNLNVEGEGFVSWANIQNNEAVSNPSVNPWNERQAELTNRPSENCTPSPSREQRLLVALRDVLADFASGRLDAESFQLGSELVTELEEQLQEIGQ